MSVPEIPFVAQNGPEKFRNTIGIIGTQRKNRHYVECDIDKISQITEKSPAGRSKFGEEC